jgi:hypothetical protein
MFRAYFRSWDFGLYGMESVNQEKARLDKLPPK